MFESSQFFLNTPLVSLLCIVRRRRLTEAERSSGDEEAARLLGIMHSYQASLAKLVSRLDKRHDALRAQSDSLLAGLASETHEISSRVNTLALDAAELHALSKAVGAVRIFL
jgi:hypothetical protein